MHRHIHTYTDIHTHTHRHRYTITWTHTQKHTDTHIDIHTQRHRHTHSNGGGARSDIPLRKPWFSLWEDSDLTASSCNMCLQAPSQLRSRGSLWPVPSAAGTRVLAMSAPHRTPWWRGRGGVDGGLPSARAPELWPSPAASPTTLHSITPLPPQSSFFLTPSWVCFLEDPGDTVPISFPPQDTWLELLGGPVAEGTVEQFVREGRAWRRIPGSPAASFIL